MAKFRIEKDPYPLTINIHKCYKKIKGGTPPTQYYINKKKITL